MRSPYAECFHSYLIYPRDHGVWRLMEMETVDLLVVRKYTLPGVLY